MLTSGDIPFPSNYKLLVWNGTTIANKPFDPTAKQININLKIFTPEPSVLETGLTVHESITLIELKNKISSFTEIPTQEMWVHKFSVNGKPRQLGNNLDSSTLFELQQLLNNLDSSTLFELGTVVISPFDFVRAPNLFDFRIISDDCLLIEKEVKGAKSKAGTYKTEQGTTSIRVKDNSIRVTNFSANTSTRNGPGNIRSFQPAEDFSLQEFRVIVCSAMNLDPELHQFRRMRDGKPGSLFGHQGLLLSKSGLGEGGELIIEKIEAPTIIEITLNIKFEVAGRSIPIMQFDAFESWTILQLKETVCKHPELNLDPKEHRMRMANYWKEPLRLLDHENRTIKQEKINDGNTVFLESGGAPVPGQITITFDQYVLIKKDEATKQTNETTKQPTDSEPKKTEKNETNEENPDKNQKTEENPEKNQKTEEGKPEDKAQADEEEENVIPISLYSPLLHFSSYTNKARYDTNHLLTPIGKLNILSSSTLAELKTQVKEAILVSPSSHVRLWHHTRVLKQDEQPLSKQFINYDCRLAIQILSQEDLLTSQSIVLYIHIRDPIQKSYSEPIEYYFHGKTLEELVSGVSTQYDIPSQFMRLSRYIHEQDYYKVLFDGPSLPNEAETQTTTETQPIVETQSTASAVQPTKASEIQSTTEYVTQEGSKETEITNETPKTDQVLNQKEESNNEQETQKDIKNDSSTKEKESNQQSNQRGRQRQRNRGKQQQNQKGRNRDLFPDGAIIILSDGRLDPENLDFWTIDELKPSTRHGSLFQKGGRSHQSSNNSNRSNRRKEESLKIHVSDEEYEYVDDEEEDGIYEQDGLYDL